jgi:hypothetical protein
VGFWRSRLDFADCSSIWDRYWALGIESWAIESEFVGM